MGLALGRPHGVAPTARLRPLLLRNTRALLYLGLAYAPSAHTARAPAIGLRPIRPPCPRYLRYARTLVVYPHRGTDAR